MLLLIPKHMQECSPIPATDKSDLLGNLFDIRLGLIEDRYLHLTKESKEHVYFITAKSFTDVPNKKREDIFLSNSLDQLKRLDPEWTKLISNNELAKKNQEKDLDEKGNIDEKKNHIKESRFLKNHDFLISIRGEPNGYSLLNVTEIKKYNFVPSHYFVRLSPRYPGNFHMEYLHLIIEQFIKHRLVERFEDMRLKTKEKGKSYAAFNSFSIEELKEETLRYHSSIEQQKEITDEYRKQFQKWHDQRLIFHQFEYNIYYASTNKPINE